MQSRTSFFNGSIFKKNVSRFWPVWGGYFAIWVILVPVVLLSQRYDYVRSLQSLRYHLLNIGYYGGLIMSAIFGIFSAMAVWSFAYNTRSAHGMACLPVRREGVFTAVTLAGLLPYLAANAAIAVLALLAELAIGVMEFGATMQMLCLMTLPFLLFYGFATFCAQLTGNILVLPAVYAVLNFVCVGAEILVRTLVGVFVFGLEQSIDAFTLRWFSPVVGILMRCKVLRNEIWNGEAYVLEGYHFIGWKVLLIYAAIGLVFLALALLLFRRRRMETAGDVVAVDVLKPVFRWCMAVGCALCLSVLVYVLFWENGYAHGEGGMACLIGLVLVMLIGAFLGWFIAEMLMKKSFRVFRGGWGGLGLCCLILAALMCGCEFDLFGYERYIPAAEKVKAVEIYCQGEWTSLEEPESIESVIALHESIVANKAWHEAETDRTPFDYSTVRLTYTLNSGRTVARAYDLRYSLDNTGDMGMTQTVLNCAEAIADRKKTAFPLTEETVFDGYIGAVMMAADCAEAAGYGSAEEYVLREYCGLSSSAAAELDESERADRIDEAVFSYAVNAWDLDKYYSYYSAVPAAAEYSTEQDESARHVDLDKVMFRYEWNFTPRQLAELYETCVLPDVTDGTLGRVWIICDEDYRNTVYSTEIHITAQQERIVADAHGAYDTYEMVEPDPYRYEYFSTTPTVDSVRTNAWLAAHGVKQYTLEEVSDTLGLKYAER